MALDTLRRITQRVRGESRSTDGRRRRAHVWDDPNRCPFCGEAIANGGPAFIEHVKREPACETDFAEWRDSVADDIGGEWGG